MKNKILLIGFLLLLYSCQPSQQEVDHGPVQTVMSSEEPIEERPNRVDFIDENKAADELLAFDEVANPCVIKGDVLCPIENYEGTLMKASGLNGGFELKFVPFDDYDHKLDQEIPSPYDFDLKIFLSKSQNDVLGYVDYSEATKNIARDYFENLFTIYYFEFEQNKYPLKFVNQGKTEWDG